jgi:hypothetical protein
LRTEQTIELKKPGARRNSGGQSFDRLTMKTPGEADCEGGRLGEATLPSPQATPSKVSDIRVFQQNQKTTNDP